MENTLIRDLRELVDPRRLRDGWKVPSIDVIVL